MLNDSTELPRQLITLSSIKGTKSFLLKEPISMCMENS